MTGSLGPFAPKAKRARAIAWAAVVLWARNAGADALAGVTWHAPASCPNEAAVRRSVRQWLSVPESELDFRSIHVEAKVQSEADGFVLEMTFASKGGSGHETLVAERCQTLADIVALKVALAADPVGTLEVVEPAERQPARRVPEPLYGLRLQAGAGLGPLPGVGPAVALVASLAFRSARIEIGGGYWFKEQARYESLPGVGADFSLVAGTIRGCATPRLGTVEFPVCAGLEAGDLRGTGFGAATVETADLPWVAAILGPALGIPLSEHVIFWVEADAVLALVRPSSYAMRNLETLYSPPVGAARAWAGAEVRFW